MFESPSPFTKILVLSSENHRPFPPRPFRHLWTNPRVSINVIRESYIRISVLNYFIFSCTNVFLRQKTDVLANYKHWLAKNNQAVYIIQHQLLILYPLGKNIKDVCEIIQMTKKVYFIVSSPSQVQRFRRRWGPNFFSDMDLIQPDSECYCPLPAWSGSWWSRMPSSPRRRWRSCTRAPGPACTGCEGPTRSKKINFRDNTVCFTDLGFKQYLLIVVWF